MNYKERIKKEIYNLGYNISNKGTWYLIELIEYTCTKDNYMDILKNLEKNAYPVIADKYNAKLVTVKNDIIYATNNMNNTRNIIKKDTYNIRLTPKMVIFQMIDLIREI